MSQGSYANVNGIELYTGRLAVLPGLTHFDTFSSPLVASTVVPFLAAPMPEALHEESERAA